MHIVPLLYVLLFAVDITQLVMTNFLLPSCCPVPQQPGTLCVPAFCCLMMLHGLVLVRAWITPLLRKQHYIEEANKFKFKGLAGCVCKGQQQVLPMVLF